MAERSGRRAGGDAGEIVGGMKRYYDVNVFVYWLGGHPEFGERAKRWIRIAEVNGAYTSSLTPYEVAVILAGITGRKLDESSLVSEVLEALESLRLKVIPLVWRDYLEAERLMGRGYDLEDALHLAVALRIGAEEIVSNDRDFDRGPLRRTF